MIVNTSSRATKSLLEANRPSQIFKGFNFWALNLSENEHLTLNDGDDVIINEAIYKDLSDLICYMMFLSICFNEYINSNNEISPIVAKL